MRHLVHRVAVRAVFILLSSGPIWAQATAELSGRVTDESGAVLPGVTVTATQTNTAFTRTVVTDGTGTYVMPNLPTGPYRLDVSLAGFRSYVQTGIVLQVGATPVVNAALAVGSLEETVSVEAAAPIVDVRNAGISEVVEQERIVELPLQGRQVTDLILLAGAAVELGRPNNRSFQGGVNIAVAGGVSFGVAYMLDGAMHNDVQNAGGLPLPFPDALQEFRVATSGLSAENGMHSGASVNAATKSGTNLVHGNGFEFLRDRRFNAKSRFALVKPDGTRADDGLRRNQYGGTLGGPIVKDRLFFFGGVQATKTRVVPTDNIEYVPTAAMLAGDFTAFASPACNNGRQLTLRAPFVNNRIDPAQFSPAALRLAAKLPNTNDPCGETRVGLPADRDEIQPVMRIDYQWTPNRTLFGRYMATTDDRPSGLSKTGGNVLATPNPNLNNLAQSFTVGNTLIGGTNMVNALRVAYNTTTVDRYNEPFFAPEDLGIKAYNYTPAPAREMSVAVTGGFTVAAVTATKGIADNKAYQLNEELTLVHGRHQIAVGGNVAYWNSLQASYARGGGTWTFNGQISGSGLGDFLLGRVQILEHGGLVGVHMKQTYLGFFAQDAWRMTDRVTVNAGLRWEPFLGQNIIDGGIANFSLDNFKNNVKSSVFRQAPAGFIYPGDAAYPSGNSGFNKEWLNLSPRGGIAWDVSGNGRTAVRASYGIAYDFPVGETWFTLAAAPPYAVRLRVLDPPGRMDDPYAPGGDPNPIKVGPDSPFPAFATFSAVDPNINSPRIQSWNVTVERQFGAAWGVSASYLGSHSDRLWGDASQNPGVYLGLDPCTLNGVSYPVCTTAANLNNRRVLSFTNPREGGYIADLELLDDVGTQSYRGLKVSGQRRAASGISLNGNYTWSRCFGLEMSNSGSTPGSGFTNPANPDFDRGHCSQDRTHLANLTVGAETPRFESTALRVLASGWRASSIVSARSGGWLNIVTGVDTAFNSVSNQRVNQVSDDVYGVKTVDKFLNRAAFANPAPGTLGNYVRNSVRGPGFWKVDLSLSRLFAIATGQQLEARLEAFNLLNNFNWGDPVSNFSNANFGRVQTLAGDMRILQFGIKYGF